MKLIKCIIFDMDGVIADAVEAHVKAEKQALNEIGLNVSEEFFYAHIGIPSKETMNELIQKNNIKADLNKLNERKSELVMEFVKKNIKPIPGAKELIQRLHENKFKLCVGSSARKKEIELILTSLNVKQYFNSITSVDEVSFGKPDPSIFLKAAGKEKTKPENCLVIEDSPYGIQATKRAGMKCIGFKSIKNKLDLSEANLIVSDLNEITIQKIKEIGE
ncbi:MAG: HAD family phosphatase [Candidatus Diapherotrites archaeon]|nr:HAD family phosphatase [Candidatus Diapherotrites archaeon]